MLMAVEASSPRVPRLGRIALRCQPDQRLVALTREGSDAAFEEIVGRYRDRLVAYAARIAPAGRGEDVVQESLMRALSALRRSGDAIELRPWLYRIVRNRALNDLRDQPAHEELSEEVDGVPEPPEVAARRAELAAMLAELKSLPDAQRRALVQRELEGRSHEEIATALAVTPGAVRGLIFRARTALRDAVGAVIPVPVLRFLAESGAGAAGGGGGGGATVAAASAGGGAVKLGVGLTVAVVAVGSGIALEVHRGHHSPPVAEAQASRDPAVAVGAADAAAVVVAPDSGGALADDGGHRGESGSGGPGPSGNGGPQPGSNSGPGSGGNGGSGASSGPGSGDQTAGSGEGGPGGSGPSFGSGSSGSGSGDPTSGSSGSGALSTEGSGTDGGTSGPG